ncbi:hypothetical protein [Luteibacter sp. ME-Dv--P-043b]|jgi:Tfp pilus assembly protein PilX|uniref:hypothetical protein n=1 Tax=Luteibacter sp. ME-Dv--P-043b TaxID=3040291 RepID=UPI002556ECE2|nr:hypothetical protein [Luteibacter sp. ME-Dv--P-043b]
MKRPRGCVLVFVLVMLAALSLIGAGLSRGAASRRLAAAEYRDRVCVAGGYDRARWQEDVAACDHR